MATTSVTASNGNVYHLYQLPEDSSREPNDIITFATLDNDLSDGYRSSVLFGSNTGTREWKLKYPTLAHSSILSLTVTDPHGANVSREQYLRSLYIENKVTGQPFAFRDWNSGQYYLVDFMDDSLSMERMRVKIFTTGLTLKQRRLEGVTIFSVADAAGSLGYDWYDQQGHGASWVDNSGSQTLTPTGDVVFSANPQNGLNTVRLSGSASTGRLNASGWSLPLYDIFIVMKMREATFSNNAGVLTDAGGSGVQYLVGTSGDTKFQNLVLSNTEYRLNDVQYAVTDMQAPMNEFGIVHLRRLAGMDFDTQVQFGKDRTTAGTFAKMDIAEIISFDQPLTRNIIRELIEHLTIKWAIT